MLETLTDEQKLGLDDFFVECVPQIVTKIISEECPMADRLKDMDLAICYVQTITVKRDSSMILKMRHRTASRLRGGVWKIPGFESECAENFMANIKEVFKAVGWLEQAGAAPQGPLRHL